MLRSLPIILEIRYIRVAPVKLFSCREALVVCYAWSRWKLDELIGVVTG